MSLMDSDRAYNARMTVSPETYQDVIGEYRRASDAVVAKLSGHRDISYDDTSDERLDIWGAVPGELRPTVLAVHGGYWRALSRHDTAFMAAALGSEEIATVTVDYTLAPAVSLEEIVRQVRMAVVWLHRNGPRYGVDPDRIIVLGSSAGAHLAAMTALRGWSNEFGLTDQPVRGLLLLSGLFDLQPLVDSQMNAWLHLDYERARNLSPLFGTPTPVPAVVAVASEDAEGFKRQAHLFHEFWGRQATCIHRTVADRNHFDLFLDLADSKTRLFQDLLALVQNRL